MSTCQDFKVACGHACTVNQSGMFSLYRNLMLPICQACSIPYCDLCQDFAVSECDLYVNFTQEDYLTVVMSIMPRDFGNG